MCFGDLGSFKSKMTSTWILIKVPFSRRKYIHTVFILSVSFFFWVFLFYIKSFSECFNNKIQFTVFNKLWKLSSETVLTKLKTSGHRRYKNSPMATLLGNPNFPKCRESKATESVSNNPNEATVTLSCLKHGFCYLENSWGKSRLYQKIPVWNLLLQPQKHKLSLTFKRLLLMSLTRLEKNVLWTFNDSFKGL